MSAKPTNEKTKTLNLVQPDILKIEIILIYMTQIFRSTRAQFSMLVQVMLKDSLKTERKSMLKDLVYLVDQEVL